MQTSYELGPRFLQESPESRQKALAISRMADQFGSPNNKLIPNEVTYLDSMKGFDSRPHLREEMSKTLDMDFTKAISIAGISAGTQDKSLIPIYVDPTIVDVTRRLTPMVELLPRVTNFGRTADFNRLTTRGVGGFVLEDAPLSDSNDTYARSSVAIKWAIVKGRVTGPFLAASRQYLSQQYIDALNLEVRNKTITMRYIEEDAIINGDATTTRTAYGGGTTISGAEYSGLLKTISTNSTDLSAAGLQIANVRTAIRNARTAGESSTLGQGDPNLILTDFVTLDNTKALLQDYLRYVNTNFEIAWGLKTLEFEGLPMIASRFMPTTSNARQLAVLSTDTWQMRVMQDLTYEELAKSNDSIPFMLKVYEALIGTAEEFNSKIIGISN